MELGSESGGSSIPSTTLTLNQFAIDASDARPAPPTNPNFVVVQ
jgi:hypothetical protein